MLHHHEQQLASRSQLLAQHGGVPMPIARSDRYEATAVEGAVELREAPLTGGGPVKGEEVALHRE